MPVIVRFADLSAADGGCCLTGRRKQFHAKPNFGTLIHSNVRYPDQLPATLCRSHSFDPNALDWGFVTQALNADHQARFPEAGFLTEKGIVFYIQALFSSNKSQTVFTAKQQQYT